MSSGEDPKQVSQPMCGISHSLMEFCFLSGWARLSPHEAGCDGSFLFPAPAPTKCSHGEHFLRMITADATRSRACSSVSVGEGRTP